MTILEVQFNIYLVNSLTMRLNISNKQIKNEGGFQ